MPKKLQKSLQEYFSKIKKPTPHIQFPNSNTISCSKKWIISHCKHPKTLSFAVDRNQVAAADAVATTDGGENGGAATLADIDRFLIENFRSLYLKDDEDIKERRKVSGKNPTGVLSDLPRNHSGESRRFFFSPNSSENPHEDSQTETSENGGSSSSSLNCEDQNHQNKEMKLPNDCIAVLKISQSPSEEFRRSMQEMMDSHLKNHEKVDWEFMEELLFSFLNLNEKKSYKFILNAFVDLIVVLRLNSDESPAKSRHVRSVRRVMSKMI